MISSTYSSIYEFVFVTVGIDADIVHVVVLCGISDMYRSDLTTCTGIGQLFQARK